MKELHSQGKTADDIAECLGRMPLHPRVIAVIKSIHALGLVVVYSLSSLQFLPCWVLLFIVVVLIEGSVSNVVFSDVT